MPAVWKLADVIPLHKKGDRCDPSNYRQISIITVVAKLCEKKVCSQLMTYLERHSLILPTAVWLPAGRSTEAAMLDVVTYVTENIDRGLVSSLVTADTSKAFDSVEHPRLLDKLGWYGIQPDWFADWLEGTGSVHRVATPGRRDARRYPGVNLRACLIFGVHQLFDAASVTGKDSDVR